ncbi:MAG: G8 domain-containing protein [Pseudomonadota bacterium]
MVSIRTLTLVLLGSLFLVPAWGQASWSEASAWLGYQPAAGDNVVIPEGVSVLLDQDTPRLGTLSIQGDLIFGTDDVTLTARQILVFGRLAAGAEGEPHPAKARIVLAGDPDDPSVLLSDWSASGEAPHHNGPYPARSLIVAPGGVLDLHGHTVDAWLQLDGTAGSGQQSLTLSREPVGWQVGDLITVAPTGFDPFEFDELRIAGVSGRTVELTRPLRFKHYGRTQSDAGIGGPLDLRAEVALLTRNISVVGEASAETAGLLDVGPGDQAFRRAGFGGHTLYLAGSTVRLAHVEFALLGNSGELGRYPVHFHHAHDASDSYVRGVSVHHTFQRGLVVHQTDNLLVEDNVVYDTVSHSVYIEDGNETGNRFLRNLAMLPRETIETLRIDNPNRTNRGEERPSAFWITNPANEFVENRAVGVIMGMGFWFVEPDNGSGTAIGRNSPHHDDLLARFERNVAHTISKVGGNLGYRFDWTGIALEINEQLKNDPGHAPIEDFVAWKVANMAIQIGPTRNIELVRPVLAESRVFVQSHNRSRAPGDTPLVVNDATLYVVTDNPPDGPIADQFSRQFPGPYLSESERPLVFQGGAILGENELKYSRRTEFRDTTTLENVVIIPEPPGAPIFSSGFE